MKSRTIGLPQCNCLVFMGKETYVQDVECQVCEWTDDVNIKDELWLRHAVLLAPFLVVPQCEEKRIHSRGSLDRGRTLLHVVDTRHPRSYVLGE